MDWGKFITFPKGTPLEAINPNAIQIRDDLYQIGESAYCIVADSDEASSPLVVISILWACSAGAAKRALFNEIEADDFSAKSPPHDLIPENAGHDYAGIFRELSRINAKGLMEHASYRIMIDGLFVNKSIEFDEAIYYFRSSSISDEEPPYVILRKLKK